MSAASAACDSVASDLHPRSVGEGAVGGGTLAADRADAPAPVAAAALDGDAWLTVVVVVAEADLRCYVRECLRECADLRVVEAPASGSRLRLRAGPFAARSW